MFRMKRKFIVLLFLLFTLHAFPVCAANGVKLPILLYHNVTDSFSAQEEQLHITPQRFREHMLRLKENGFQTISFQQYYDYRTQGSPLPEKPIIISFDDGYITNYEHAYPILKECGFIATFFAVAKSSFLPTAFPIPHYDWRLAKEMEASGVIEVESHSYTHPKHTDLSLADIEQEARLSYYTIKTFLGKEPLVYSYPNGAFSEQSKQLVKKAGYQMQVKVGNDGVNTDLTPLDELRRINIGGLTTPDQLISLLLNALQE